MMRSFLLALWLGTAAVSNALFAEDAGVLDFLVATGGHGVTSNVILSLKDTFLTSDSANSQWDPSSSCTVASRFLSKNGIQWRRNVCTSKKTPNHAVASGSDGNSLFYTNDANGSVRAWTANEGALVWDVPPTTFLQEYPRVWAVSSGIVAGTSTDKDKNDVLTFYNSDNGHSLGSVDAKTVGNGSSRWLHVLPSRGEGGVIQALVAHVSNKNGQVLASKVVLVDLILKDGAVQVGSSKKVSDSSFQVSTLQVLAGYDGNWNAVALDAKGTHLVHFSSDSSLVHDISALHPMWTSMGSIDALASNDIMIQIVGEDNRYSPPRHSMAMFRLDSSTNIWDQWYEQLGEEETQFRGIAYCPESKLVAAVEQSGHVTAFNVKPIETTKDSASLSRGERHRTFSPLSVGDVEGDDIRMSENDAVSGYQVVSCQEKSMSLLVTTARGTTIQQTLSRSDASGKIESSVVWTAEEGLGQVSDALLLDATHPASVLDAISKEEEAEALRRLSFSARLQAQVDDVVSFFTTTSTSDSRDVDFGFVKVAVLLSQTAHRVWGMPTSGATRGSIGWMVDLPQNAVWHSLVHGTSNSKAEVHGINGGTHSPEVLVLSSFADNTMEWTCLDGITGEVHSNAVTTLSSPVQQVLPIFGGYGKCRQLAVLVHQDNSVTLLPGDDVAKEIVTEHIRANKNGLYTHAVDRTTNVLESFEIVGENSSFAAKLAGRTDFPGEQVVKVAYPNRDEVVQAPCHILGDDSLLLKYLNPHLAVIVTMSDGDSSSTTNGELARALNSVTSGGKRKPAGATPPGEAAPETKPVNESPNLFLNVVDTVSGRVLHRASHANASPEDNIPVLISENWVFYAFFNEKIRRTEVGVFTLYEGMIDKNGLTAFHSPEQALTFSSLEARDSKPVVLAKTYVIPKTIAAMGITSTRGGISSRHVILATGDDRLVTVPRQMLEPRRPTGDVKDSEKQEGLYKYSPLVPLVSLMTPTYNQTVNVDAIISTSAGLESQSLVLAYGGADVFFTRLAPSKGFDLLPESFNKILLSIVVVGLLIAVAVVRSMGTKKLVKLAWS